MFATEPCCWLLLSSSDGKEPVRLVDEPWCMYLIILGQFSYYYCCFYTKIVNVHQLKLSLKFCCLFSQSLEQGLDPTVGHYKN